MKPEDLANGMLDDLVQKEAFDYQKVADAKVEADETSLVIAGQSHLALPNTKAPVVRRLADDRLSKRAAETQIRALQTMMYTAQRTEFASETIKVVTTHAQVQLDETGEVT